MNIEEKFNEIYKRFILEFKSNFEEIEEQRENALHENKKNKIIVRIVELLLLIIVIISFTVFGVVFKFEGEYEKINEIIFMACFLIAFMFPVFIVILRKKRQKEYDEIYKEKIIRNFIKIIYPTLEYYPEGEIAYEEYKNLAIEHCNSFISKDVIKGMNRNDKVTIARIRAEYNYFEHSGDESRARSYETFEGLFAKLELQKDSNIQLFVKNKKQLKEKLFDVFLADAGQVVQSEKNEKILKKEFNVLENNQLKDIFNIYSSDLNCDILDSETSSTLRALYDIQKFEFAIKEKNIYIRFWDDGIFSEPPLKDKEFTRVILYDIYKTLYLVFYLLDILKNKIYK